MIKTKENLTNKIFGRLTVIKQVEDRIQPSGQHKARWECRCNCENHTIIVVDGDNLKSHKTLSCGCFRKEKIAKDKHKYNKYDLTNEYGIG